MMRVPVEELMEVVMLQLQTAQRANLTVTGGSMLPMLRQYRDTVQLKPIDGRLQPGDIALYRRDNGRYVLHRVIRLTEDGYLFCGDNQAELEPVRQDQLMALVTGFTKKGKQHQTEELCYRLYQWIWVKLFFARAYYIRLRRWLGRLRNRLKQSKRGKRNEKKTS